jgi:hypothetical protein
MTVVRVVQRLRAEFTAMPGLRLTETQAQRLCGTDGWTSLRALRALVSAGFLHALPDGSYGRADVCAGTRSAAGGLR